MPSEKLYKEFQSLERKIQLLLGENQSLKTKLTQSKEENDVLKEQMESHKASISSFQHQVSISKLTDDMTVTEGTSAKLKEEIENYISEIDKCIAHLGE